VALARLELADLLGDIDPHLALEEAQAAAATLEKVGARRWGDRAAQVVRKLGGPSRTGRKDGHVLTNREREVLRLIGYGYTNSQIADRLFISIKTAGHHVSSVLSKLGMQGRAEAAAYSATLPPEE
jgi:DNA-binding CsgD family transcriptional regulator